MKPYLGKYRGKVANNVDPLQLGRVQVSVPAVYGDGTLNWAMPCVPYAGPQVGFFAIPPTGANVWVEFEQGDPDYPIWTGCFWGPKQVPASPAVAEIVTLRTELGAITLSDLPNSPGVTIETKAGMKIAIDLTGIEISNGKGAVIKLTGPQVSVNNGGFAVGCGTCALGRFPITSFQYPVARWLSGLLPRHVPRRTTQGSSGIRAGSRRSSSPRCGSAWPTTASARFSFCL